MHGGARLTLDPMTTRTTGLLTVGTLLFSACSATTSSSRVTAAPEAASPACATALAAAPATVADLPRTPVPVVGARSWGGPAMILRCGLPPHPPTTKPCLGVNGIDWVVDTERDPFVFVSYGRDPAVELRVPAVYGRDVAVAAVTDANPIAAALPRNGRSCIGPGDVTSSPAGRAAASLSATRSAG